MSTGFCEFAVARVSFCASAVANQAVLNFAAHQKLLRPGSAGLCRLTIGDTAGCQPALLARWHFTESGVGGRPKEFCRQR
jgi:hypothetical protein